MSKFNHFNVIGPIYDLIFGRRRDYQIVQLLQLQKDQSLLDVGGGTGRVSVLFSEVSEHLFVADSAMNMLSESLDKGIPSVNSQSEWLPFPDGTFDRIIMVDALHHVANQKQTLNEIWRLIAPGGKIIIEEPDIRNFFVKLIALGEKFMLMRSHFLAPNLIAELCQFGEQSDVEIHCERGIAWIIITRSRNRD